jgi:hypothetical protein
MSVSVYRLGWSAIKATTYGVLGLLITGTISREVGRLIALVYGRANLRSVGSLFVYLSIFVCLGILAMGERPSLLRSIARCTIASAITFLVLMMVAPVWIVIAAEIGVATGWFRIEDFLSMN